MADKWQPISYLYPQFLEAVKDGTLPPDAHLELTGDGRVAIFFQGQDGVQILHWPTLDEACQYWAKRYGKSYPRNT